MLTTAKYFLRTLSYCIFLWSSLLAVAAHAQTFSVDTDGVAVVGSSSPIDIGWDFATGGGITGFQVTISYDAAVFTADLTNCLSGASLDNQGCVSPSPGVIGLTFFRGQGLPDLSGSVAFTPVNPATLVDGTEYVLTVQEQAGQTTPSTASVTTSNGKITASVIAPALSVDPTSASFTAQNGSTSSPVAFTVTNTGNADDLTLTAALSGSDASKYSIASNNCPASAPGVAQNGTCTIQVQFSPDAIDTFNDANLVLTSNGGNATVDLDGEGTAGPAGAITITPAGPFDFGELLAGIEEETQAFTATNTGAAGSVVTISNAALNLLFGSPLSIVSNTCTSGVELEKDESCVVTVKEAPVSPGTAERTLTVSGTDANGTQLSDTVTIKGEGIEEARPTSSPASGASQSEVVGPEGENDFTVIFGNEGNLPYNVTCGIGEDDNADIWSVTGGVTTSVDAGETHTVTTTCELPDTETYTATLSCSVGQETFTFNYECVGLPPLPVPVDNKWALALLALMMLMAASFGFRFIARQ